MIALLLLVFAGMFAEVATAIGKYETAHRKETVYAMGFLNIIWALIFLLFIGFYNDTFRFSLESLPTFAARAALEMVLVFITLNAIVQADRSTFSFLRILTIPLLLLTDLVLGYDISTYQIAGIFIIVGSFVFLFLNHGLSKRGKLLSLISAVMAVGTISLYKYNITHYNSVEAEQAALSIVVIITLAIAGWLRGHDNVFKYLFHRTFLAQSVASGLASVLASYAYAFAPASVIATANRAIEVLISIISGKWHFHEKQLAVKLTAFIFIVAGIGLTVF